VESDSQADEDCCKLAAKDRCQGPGRAGPGPLPAEGKPRHSSCRAGNGQAVPAWAGVAIKCRGLGAEGGPRTAP
jgi:hypothetical protein